MSWPRCLVLLKPLCRSQTGPYTHVAVAVDGLQQPVSHQLRGGCGRWHRRALGRLGAVSDSSIPRRGGGSGGGGWRPSPRRQEVLCAGEHRSARRLRTCFHSPAVMWSCRRHRGTGFSQMPASQPLPLLLLLLSTASSSGFLSGAGAKHDGRISRNRLFPRTTQVVYPDCCMCIISPVLSFSHNYLCWVLAAYLRVLIY